MHSFLKWRDALNLAPNCGAVEAIMRDYVVAIAPIVEGLPGDCRDALASPLDIQAAAVTLMQAELRSRGLSEEHAVLHEIAHTFASAAVRAAQLHWVPAPPELPDRRVVGADR
jgi:hypothetical protein